LIKDARGQGVRKGSFQYTARTATLKMSLPITVPAFTIQRQCSSAMQAIVSGFQMIRLGEADVIIAGGVETISSAPYVLKTVR